MLRVRFKADYDDPRPITWPVAHPYWVSGTGSDYSIVVSYADSEDYIRKHWPEAKDLDIEEVDGYTFTSRFPCPDWFKDASKD